VLATSLRDRQLNKSAVSCSQIANLNQMTATFTERIYANPVNVPSRRGRTVDGGDGVSIAVVRVG